MSARALPILFLLILTAVPARKVLILLILEEEVKV